MVLFRVDAKRVAQLIAGESVETGVVDIQIGGNCLTIIDTEGARGRINQVLFLKPELTQMWKYTELQNDHIHLEF